VVTALGTVTISLEWAILAGICVALVTRRMTPRHHPDHRED
jgi:MFS superfamily sulfate permease-like transporter